MTSKYFKLCFVAFFLLSVNVFSQVDTTFHIYLMFGQSNMEGAGAIETQDKTVDPRFKIMEAVNCSNLGRTKGNWYPAVPPLCRCYTGLTPGDYFGRTMVSRLPSNIKIGVVMVAVAGSSIQLFDKDNYQAYLASPTTADWLKNIANEYGGNPYQYLVDLAKLAQKDGVIKGILLHQGETNNGDTTWKNNVKKIVTDLKSDLGLGDIPFLAGETLYAEFGGCCSLHNAQVSKLPSIIPNAHVVSAAGLPGVDYAHFTSASYRTLGARYAQQMLKYGYNICDSTTTESWYKENGGTLKQTNNITAHTGKQLTLSPRPQYLGAWSWSGAGTSGASREQVINTTTQGTYKAVATYTNACGTVSRLPIQIVVCDSTITQSWYQINGGASTQASTIIALKGANLVLSPHPTDGTGTWSWAGAGTSGSSREQTINTSAIGTYNATVTYTNSCGAQTRLPIKITVCDSTAVESWYQIDGGTSVKSDSIKVKQNAVLKLLPNPSTGGTWSWTGAGTSGSAREQIVNTSTLGTFIATATYTNVCGIPSRKNITVIVYSTTGFEESKADGNNVEIFPNPVVNGTLTILGIEKISKVEILNLIGEKVAVYNNVHYNYSMDIKVNLKPGIYVVKLSNGQQITYKKVIFN
jgi:hypothetical protein